MTARRYTEAQVLEACARVLDAAGRPSRAVLLRSGEVPVELLVLDTEPAPRRQHGTVKPTQRRQRRSMCCGVTLVGTHFHWCAEVGGGGTKGSERPVQGCEPPPPPAKTWGKPRPYSHPAPGDDGYEDWAARHDAVVACPHDAMTPVFVQPKVADRGATGPAPGYEITKDLRPVVKGLQRAGWRYDPGKQRSSKGLPRVYPPGSPEAIRIPTASQKFALDSILHSLRKAGAPV